MKSRLLILDTVDDRKEVYQSLLRLSPRSRLAWLAWCCERAPLPNSDKRPMVTPLSRGEVWEVNLDFWSLVADFDFDPLVGAKELERRVRKRGRRLGAR